ncbi:right-handed parallel beta-helix repeat-containing protein [Candidatus Bathyarchaeota archaeon]|nr:right-handed parallel beta-helix repeat-containing protein [Candidatus Bathyarchaeota archaeon]
MLANFSILLNSTVAISEQKTITVPDDFETIQDAINNAISGDKILVKAGTYNEEWISVDKPISLVGDNKKSIVNYHSGTGFIITADNVQINGFTITNFETQKGYAISLLDVNNCSINNNLIENNLVGISIIGYSLWNTISENIVDHNNRSIELINANENTITENNITSALVSGISLDASSGNIVSKNRVSDLVDGMGALMLWQSSSNTILRNLLFGGNLFLMVDCSNNIFSENFVLDSDYGVLVGNSSDNLFYNNYFVNIKKELVIDQMNLQDLFSENVWDNGVQGNYWSDYAGNDIDRDSIGDSVYVLYGNNKDNYPLMDYPEISTNPEMESKNPDSFLQTFDFIPILIIGISIILVVVVLVLIKQRKKLIS